MINKLHISGFRSFKDLTVEGLGRVNLITGRNNVGKSTLLEAVRLWATEGDEATLLQILNYREEAQSINADNGSALHQGELAACNHLFHGFPKLEKCSQNFSITGEDGGSTITITARIDWLSSAIEEIQGRHYLPGFDEATERTIVGVKYPILRVETPGFLRVIRLNRSSSYQIRKQDSFGTSGTICLFLDPFSSRATSQLATLWDQVALTDSAIDVIQALQIIAEDIQAVTMIGTPAGNARTAIVRSSAYDHPIPLKSFGDGVNRVFGLILSLTCVKGGYLLVDEIENGLHHSILTDAFRAIFKLARKLDVQVFATTHSRDCIEAFQQAAEESPDDGVLVRLTRKNDRIFSTVFPEKQLQIVTENQIEVR